MLRKVRITLALIFWILITWLLVDFTGTAHVYLGWMAKIQFLPALIAMNIGALLFIVALTLLFGRIYCSIICPLGVMQDVIAWFRKKRNKYSYSEEKGILRASILAITGFLLTTNLAWVVGLIAPYSTYGKIVGTIFSPLYKLANNGLAMIAEHYDSYAFYEVDVWLKSIPALVAALAAWIIIGVLAWRGGRTWCNTICPVGTFLGMLAKYSRLKINIDTNACNGCRKCERNCKASCINAKTHEIDYSRCVTCGDCIEQCAQKAISFRPSPVPSLYGGETNKVNKKESLPIEGEDRRGSDRRTFLTGMALLAGTSLLKAQEKTTDGGLAEIEDKKKPEREKLITPPGSISARNLAEHCTSCQLCINSCPNDVLRPSNSLDRFMQPEVSYERGYCRPECTRCSDVCPTGAIKPITIEQKTAIQVGHAVWIKENCLPAVDGIPCGNCARHCPTGAIQMVPLQSGVHQDGGRWLDADNQEIPRERVLLIPVVNEEKCIGCGACENLCPSRPFSAIYVEGHEVHREI
ncbi:MAG: 4Fe-4S dicluster domain-containing protein [Bacteroidaceae bacterium]|nr:4Fe-4S dicluster domain-containing protein [Bacteroidaceae bacterium]